MTAEQRITSLLAPPEDWSGSMRSRRLRALGIGRVNTGSPPKLIGPRADAEPTSDLWTIRFGIDPAPSACPHCGSASLTTEPPLGEHTRGLVTCYTCSRQVCWLAPGVTTRAAPHIAGEESCRDIRREGRLPERSSIRHGEYLPETRQERKIQPGLPNLHSYPSAEDDRTDGCGVACRRLSDGRTLHNARLHEQWGRQQVLNEIEARPVGIVRTGPLVIDCAARRIWVDGAELVLSELETRLLLYLAQHLGEVCSHAEIVEAVWGAAQVEIWSVRSRHGAFHPLRVRVYALCSKLGSARRLIQTRKAVGYCLVQEAPCESP